MSLQRDGIHSHEISKNEMLCSNNTKCEYISMFLSFFKRCMDIMHYLIHGSYNKNCTTVKWTLS